MSGEKEKMKVNQETFKKILNDILDTHLKYVKLRDDFNTKNKKSREFEEEASESSAESDDRSCEETDRNAKALFTEASNVYRSSILGVRNKSNALQDWRVATEPCSICDRFAEFLQFFKR
jgi:hypothetical protein